MEGIYNEVRKRGARDCEEWFDWYARALNTKDWYDTKKEI